MRIPSLAIGVLLVAAAQAAEAKSSVFIYEEAIEPPYYQEARGEHSAEEMARRAFVQEARVRYNALRPALAGKTILLAEPHHKNADRDFEGDTCRQPGVLRILYVAESPAAGMESSTAINHRRTRVTLVQEALWRGGGSHVSSVQFNDVTLAELNNLRRAPADMVQTALGALLRRTWAEVLAGNEDDIETIQARLTPIVRIFNADGSQGSTFKLTPLNEGSVANVVLGRGRDEDELRTISDGFAMDMQVALVKARKVTDDNEVWGGLNAIRSGPPRGLTQDEKDLLDRLLEREPAQQQGPPKAGLMAVDD